MPRPSSTLTASQAELDAARLDLLRRRIVILAYVVAVVLICLSCLIQWTLRSAGRPVRVMSLGPALGGVMMIAATTARLLRGRERRMRMSMNELVWRLQEATRSSRTRTARSSAATRTTDSWGLTD